MLTHATILLAKMCICKPCEGKGGGLHKHYCLTTAVFRFVQCCLFKLKELFPFVMLTGC